MSICAQCGLQLPGDSTLCPHHHCAYGVNWAKGNILMCNFLHRGIVPPRLPPEEREGHVFESARLLHLWVDRFLDSGWIEHEDDR